MSNGHDNDDFRKKVTSKILDIINPKNKVASSQKVG
jgi:hypothetical protein